MASITRGEVVRHLATTGGASILIKVANGILAYVMLLLIARATTTAQYGIFAVAFSVATTVSFAATLGQPLAVTRYWPQWMGQYEPLKARALLKLSMILTALGLGGTAAMFVLAGALDLFVEMPWSFGIAATTALFGIGLGWAEFASAGLRAQGFVVWALAPRDVLWRVGVCTLFGGAAMAGTSFDAESVVLIVSVMLCAAVAPQILALLRSTGGAPVKGLLTTHQKTLSRYSLIMWTITSFQLLRDFAGVVLASMLLGPDSAGAYFAADRTANLLSFFLLAVNLVAAPQISRYYHSGRKDLVRVIVGLTGAVAGLTALVSLAFFVIFGAEILRLFNSSYADYLPILLILSCGRFLNAATGPIGLLLMLSGHERVTLILSVGAGSASVVLQAIGGFYFGAAGIATAAAAGIAASNVIAAVYAWRKLGIDSTGIALAVRALRTVRTPPESPRP